jgi:biotin synthase
VRFGYGTVVLQSGEDYGVTAGWMASVVRRIKSETPLAVTLSLGERPEEDLAAWREAGADRYLLRFETSDRTLYESVHPGLGGRTSDRIAILKQLRRLGYEVGSGIMVGLPGQTYQSVAGDIALFQALDLDMIGVGPFIPHPGTPLGGVVDGPVPNSESMVWKVIALARILCPEANIPSTTALATINRESGRELALQRGANVVMPNLTPVRYRRHYEIYPNKACLHKTGETCNGCLRVRLAAIGRCPGTGRRRREPLPVSARLQAQYGDPLNGSMETTLR